MRMFQSPRSGKFESNFEKIKENKVVSAIMFQSPRSGKFESNLELWESGSYKAADMFQSPRSGKFESNRIFGGCLIDNGRYSFNPLDRGNLNQI